MLFTKNDLKIEVDNPVCHNLFIRQGWTPVNDEVKPAVVEESDAAETPIPLTAESDSVVDEPLNQIELVIEEEAKNPTVKAETAKAASSKSTTQKRTYQKRK